MSSKKKSLLTWKFIVFLVVMAVVSMVITTLYRSNQLAKEQKQEQTKNKNPNVIKLPPVDKKENSTGHLPQEDARYREKKVFPYLKKHSNGIKECFYNYKGDKKLKTGVIGLDFVILGDGKVEKMKTYKDGVGNSDVTACILKETEKWSFPKHKFSASIPISFPFFFSIGKTKPKK